MITEYAWTGICPDFAFTFGVRVRFSFVTSGGSGHGHVVSPDPQSKDHSVPSTGSSTTGAGRFRVGEIDSCTRRHFRFWATDSSGPTSRGTRCCGCPSSMSGLGTLLPS